MKPWYSGWPLALLTISLAAALYAAPDATLKWTALLGVVFLGVWNLPKGRTS